METAHAEHKGWRQRMGSTVETAHAVFMRSRKRMRSTCGGDSAREAHAVETVHSEHMVGDSAC